MRNGELAMLLGLLAFIAIVRDAAWFDTRARRAPTGNIPGDK